MMMSKQRGAAQKRQKAALDILENADWKATTIGEHVYIRARYKGNDVSIRDDDSILTVKKNGKTVEVYDVGGTEEFESLFGLFWGW